jgi:hypothetical protein
MKLIVGDVLMKMTEAQRKQLCDWETFEEEMLRDGKL